MTTDTEHGLPQNIEELEAEVMTELAGADEYEEDITDKE